MTDSIYFKEGSLVYRLPSVGPTGKIRIKRSIEHFGEPISLNTPLGVDDYFEWQISYFLGFGTIWDEYKKAKKGSQAEVFDEQFKGYKDERLVEELKTIKATKRSVFFQDLERIFTRYNETIVRKSNGNFVEYELSDILRKALKQGLIVQDDINELLNFRSVNTLNLENQYKVTRVFKERVAQEFEYYDEKVPLLIKQITTKSWVEIILKHKQKAVGYQSMIYFCSNVSNAFDNKGKAINQGKLSDYLEVHLPITKKDMQWIVKSFMVASQDHGDDLAKILRNL